MGDCFSCVPKTTDGTNMELSQLTPLEFPTPVSKRSNTFTRTSSDEKTPIPCAPNVQRDDSSSLETYSSSSDYDEDETSESNPKILGRKKPPDKLGHYKLIKVIGKGAFGKVYKCIHCPTLHIFAMKTVNIRSVSAAQQKDIKSEAKLLELLPPHPNIVRFIDTVEDAGFFGIVLEYLDEGSLKRFLREFHSEMTERTVATFISQVLCGLDFLHRRGIIHRDIKAANVLVTNDGVLKLADFGAALSVDDTVGCGAENVMGSPYWMAPEIISMRGQVTTACDIWAVGSLTIELMTGHPPYHELQHFAAMFRIVRDPHPSIPQSASRLLTQFLLLCFLKDPSLRPTAKALLGNKWLRAMGDRRNGSIGFSGSNPKKLGMESRPTVRDSEVTGSMDSDTETAAMVQRLQPAGGSMTGDHREIEVIDTRSEMMKRGQTRSVLYDVDDAQCDTIRLKQMTAIMMMNDLTPNQLERRESTGGMDEAQCHIALTDDDALSQGTFLRNMNSSSSHLMPPAGSITECSRSLPLIRHDMPLTTPSCDRLTAH